jgi:hypothetical protein
MSDRTQGSVRTGATSADVATPDGTAPGAAPDEGAPVTATQSIPTTGSQRAQAPATGSAPEAAAATGSGAPAAGSPADGPPKAPTVPPAAGATPVVAPDTARPAATGDADQTGARARGRGLSRGGRGPRRARLQLRHIDTWSALKISLVLSIALFFIWMVAVGVLYGVLSALGVFDTLNDLFGQIGSASGSENTGDVVTAGLVFGGAAVIGAINIVLMTALCTVGTFIYNLCSDLVGGLELTLSERD